MHGSYHIRNPRKTTARKDRSPQNYGEERMQRKDINDFHEAAYLLAQGCAIAQVFVIPMTEKFAWSITLSGNDIEVLSAQYRNKEAIVNVNAFLSARDAVRSAIDAELSSGRTGGAV